MSNGTKNGMKTILLASSRSGISLLSGILDCSRNVSLSFVNLDAMCTSRPEYELSQIIPTATTGIFSITPGLIQKHGVTILDLLYVLKHRTPLKFLWLIRNPLVASASCVKMLNISAREALKFWYVSNVCLWYFFSSLTSDRKMHVRYEDIILNFNVVRGVFQFIGEEYDIQYLQYGDFDHEPVNCPIFLKGRVDRERIDSRDKSDFIDAWKEYQNSQMVVDMGYNNYFD